MKAELIIHGARVFTADPDNPFADSLAIRSSRIMAVGRQADIDSLRGPDTRVIPGKGNTLMPGFIDSHYHLQLGSVELADAQLEGVHSQAALAARLRAYAQENIKTEWIVGQRMPYLAGALLTRHDLDRIIADKPLVLCTYDGHTVWANSAALERAGLLHGAETAPGSEIVMLPDGTASGELREPAAFQRVTRLIPGLNEAGIRRQLQRGLAQAAALGITSIHNMDGDLQQLTRYMAMEDLGELTLRVYVPFSVTPETEAADLEEALEMAYANPGGMARGGAAKFFMDGVIESYTALMLDDYADAPGNCGSALYSAELFNRLATACDRLGLQIFVHAIGDAAVQRTLDGYESVQKANGRRDSRHRVEHIEVVHPDDLPRFRELGAIASIQPEHAPGEAESQDIWPSRVGPQRWDHSFAWRWLREAGARLIFGSDWPVVTQSPFRGLQHAVTRQPWQPGGFDHSQTLSEALHSYTSAAAYAEFMELDKGMLKAGMLADLVLLDADLFSIDPGEIEKVRPVMTMVDGKVVYEQDL
jgi:predicted amidohydrolase YtcJ